MDSSSALSDLRSMAMAAPVDLMRQGLAEYEERRRAFRAWLQGQLKSGVHYGYPPGVSQSKQDDKKWRSKPSLYKAGAGFVADLMGLRAEFSTDVDTWRMLGEPKETLVRLCRLYSRATGELIGEGTGARKVGDKSMNLNASLKMADKSALVAAVINTYGLSDLYTQDIEDDPQPRREPPATPATSRVVTFGELKELKTRWNELNPQHTKEPEIFNAFVQWAAGILGVKPDVLRDPSGWQPQDVDACWAELG